MTITCNIVTDSCCDFSAKTCRERDLAFLSFTYTEADLSDGGFSGTDDLFQSRTAQQFYDAIRAGSCPMTSQPSQLAYEESFERALASGLPTVYITLSSGISGAYGGACAALQRFKEVHGQDVPIYVVDSLVGSTTQHLLVWEALNKRDEGWTAEQIVSWLKDARYRLHTIFLVDNLNALHRGGRVPKSVAVVGDALDVKPLLTFDLDGSLAIMGVARGRKKAMRRLVDHYDRMHRDDECGPVVAVGDADCPNDGYALSSALLEEYADLTVLRSTIGPTIGCHVGPGMLSCCFWGEDRRTRGNNDVRKPKGVRQE